MNDEIWVDIQGYEGKYQISNIGRVKSLYLINGQQKPTWQDKTGIECPNSIKVNQYDLQNNFIKQWDSLRDVQRELNIFAVGISRCCKGKQKTAGNYKWRYAND